MYKITVMNKWTTQPLGPIPRRFRRTTIATAPNKSEAVIMANGWTRNHPPSKFHKKATISKVV